METYNWTIRSRTVHQSFVFGNLIRAICYSRGKLNGNSGFYRQIFQAFHFCKRHLLSRQYFDWDDRICHGIVDTLHGIVANTHVRSRYLVLSVP